MSFAKLLSQIKAKKIGVLGDLMLDEYLEGSSHRISPEAPVPIVAVSKRYQVLGGAANTAANIVSLGGKVLLMGALGKDFEADYFKKLCKEKKIQLRPFYTSAPTIKKTRVIGQSQQVVRVDFENIQALSPEIENQIYSQLEKEIFGLDCLVFSDYAKGFFSKILCKKLIQLAKKNKIPVIVDPRPQHWSYYVGCDFITPNWKEACEMSGFLPEKTPENSTEKLALEISKKLKSNVVLTLGPRGLFYFSKNKKERFHLPTAAKEVFDVSGAGDTVVAAFALGLGASHSIFDSLKFANAAAGIVVAKHGTDVVSPEEIEFEQNAGSRILARSQLKNWSKNLKQMGKTIVTINGSFDLLHAGHLEILKEAKNQGDVLLIGLNSDSSVKKYKGPKRPIVDENNRAKMLLALEYVDYVHVFKEDNPIKFLSEVFPHVHVNGSEYGKNCIEADIVKKGKGVIHVVNLVPGLSTSNIINKIKEL